MLPGRGGTLIASRCLSHMHTALLVALHPMQSTYETKRTNEDWLLR